ncbi:isocitrate lyase/PEP mutase family protein [Massilia glaciei]|uniref:Isocitrate lyase/phosphoenolpyruvate mutase family protein n=1 Tax=Massilia glaciei TaxID=1524097 RepID=A0A2U2HM46_9BURK|nr:isocitrate lyase/phosphoenolpyruvate mutase family protein [Massilia glaciei]PWF48594.1 isocitrate lyase/phosphoenolpyruvate mutase family protein [Massilia glaciei]
MSPAFHALHQRAQPLMLPNAWDAGSARLIESLGARAIATTSADLAWSLGYRDGDLLPVDLHVAGIGAIARVITIPLSADIEGCYSDDPSEVGAMVARLIDLGVAGINLQNGAAHPDLLCVKIGAARRAADRLGVSLYINARTDVFYRALVPPEARVAETLARAARYRDAGADGLFPLGLADPVQTRAVAGGTELLLNVIAWPGLPSAPELGALGVRRVSAGSWIPQTLWAHTTALVTGFLADGRSEPLFAAAAPYAAINAAFAASSLPP